MIADGIVQYPSPGCDAGQLLLSSAYVTLEVDSTSPIIVRSGGLGPVIQHAYPDTCSWTYWELVTNPRAGAGTLSVQKQYPTSLYHLAAHGPTGLYYWRTPIGIATKRTVVLGTIANSTVVTSPVSLKAAIVFRNGFGVNYFESSDAGVTWGGGAGFGVQHSIGAPDVDGELTAVYDYDDNLHILFESFIGDRGVALKHWSQASGITTVAEATWEHTSIEMDTRDISYPQLGVGVGEHLNYLYLVWSQFGSQESNTDVSSIGKSNSDLWLSISPNGGQSWDAPRNLTNSATPGCTNNCWSEVHPSLAEIVDSNLHIRFIRDLRAGVSTTDTLTRTKNPVYYMRVLTPEPVAAPRMTGVPSQIGPLYLKYRDHDTVTVTIENPGTAPLIFAARESEGWLSFVPDADSVTAEVVPGGPSQTLTLAVDVSALPAGIHQGILTVTSNDPAADSIIATVIVDLTSDVVAHFKLGNSGGTNCWGWTGPDGNEYALMGTTSGITVIDATRRKIIQTVLGPGPCGYTWRDIKTYRHYAYAVSECTGVNEGMMVIDLQYLPDSVHFISAYAPLSVDQSHSLTIDTAKGFAYLAGPSTSGIWTRSLLNPAAPVHVYSMPNECHDLFARNDTLWVAEGGEGSFSVWNVSNKTSPALISRVSIPAAGYVHNIWISADGQTAATTEETTGKTVKFWDISDLTDVQLIGQYLGGNQLAHNVHIEDNFAIIAHYTSGVSVLDITNPVTPTLLHNFDTYPGSEAGEFAGCWGVYPHTKSGQIYASNMDGDFYILQFEELMTTCACPCHGDPACDGTQSDVQDVVAAIDAVFRGGESTQAPNCPVPDVDVDCSGTPDIVDVVKFIDVAFRGVSASSAFCSACE